MFLLEEPQPDPRLRDSCPLSGWALGEPAPLPMREAHEFTQLSQNPWKLLMAPHRPLWVIQSLGEQEGHEGH